MKKIVKLFSSSAEQTMRVSDKSDFFQIIVSHHSTKNRIGGAESYHLNKKTWKSDMIWHEHPQRLKDGDSDGIDSVDEVDVKLHPEKRVKPVTSEEYIEIK